MKYNAMEAVTAMIEKANGDLVKMTIGGFPFTLNEVRLTASKDSAGIYIMSGETPVASIPRGAGEAAVAAVGEEIRDLVDATRAAIERRAHLKDDAEMLASASEAQDRAEKLLKEAGVPLEECGFALKSEVADELLSVAKTAVRKANRGIDFVTGGGYHNARLKVKAYRLGFVVSAGGKACLVTRYPKVYSPKTVEKTKAYIEADMEALAGSRRRYLALVRAEAEKQEAMHQLAHELDRVEGQLRAVAM